MESLIALAIMSIIAVSFVAALSTSSMSAMTSAESTSAESLVTGHMDYIWSQPSSSNPWAYTLTSSQRSSSQQPSWWDADNPPLLPAVGAGYRLTAQAADFDADGDGTLEIPGDDEGIRHITVSIYHPEASTDPLFTLEANKTSR
jgi:Tfp pilus assembly protein PilV